MKHDILTVMWKERKYLLKPRGSRARGAMVVGIPAVMALLLPLQLSEGLMETPFSFALAFIVALMVVGMTIPDSIAGERERHTLETLLASRLDDMAILTGKIAVPVLFGWAGMLIVHAVALTVFNIANWNGTVQIYPGTILFGNVALGIILPVLIAGLGVHVSLKSATVQGAEQMLMVGMMVPLVGLQIFGVVALSVGGAGSIERMAKNVDWNLVLAGVTAVLVALAIISIWTAKQWFRRARLIA